jgi:microcystin-dependent protein
MAFLAIAPTGTVLPFAGTTAPDGWLLCDGTEKSRTTYAKLFAVIAETYGVGDGSTTFNVPDMRGVFPRGSGTNGTANYGGVTGHTPAGGSLADKGGQKTAKNGLSSTASAETTSVSGNKNQLNFTTPSAGNHTHSTSHLVGSTSTPFFTWTSAPTAGGGTYGFGYGDYQVSNAASGHAHSVSYSGTFSAAGTTPAGTVTVASADSETAPASLSLNYIIKL